MILAAMTILLAVSEPATRRTVREHLPPEAQAYFLRDRHWCVAEAARIGPACAELVDTLLADRIVERLRAAQGVIRLAERFAPAQLEAACRRALDHDSPFYRTVKTLLTCRAELLTATAPMTAAGAYLDQARFVRSARTLFLTETDREIRLERSFHNPEGDLRS